MARMISLFISVGLLSSTFYAGQNTTVRPPVIDMHTHIDAQPGPAIMDSLNVRYWFLSERAGELREWAKLNAMANRYLPALSFPCPAGRDVIFGKVTCYDNGAEWPDISWLRGEMQSGRIKALGEVLPEYMGIAPDDPVMESYWALAEEFDVPVGIHMGPGPPGAAYESSPAPMKHPNYRMAYGDPMLLEEVLLRHKRLRLFVMHAGWPRLESMMALLYAHPHVYVDTGGLQSDGIVPRAGYYRSRTASADASCSARTSLIRSRRASTQSWRRTSCPRSRRPTSSVITPHVSCGSMPESANHADRNPQRFRFGKEAAVVVRFSPPLPVQPARVGFRGGGCTVSQERTNEASLARRFRRSVGPGFCSC